MAAEVYMVGDPHFFHEGIIDHALRPFRNAPEMNEALVENWNATVGPKDEVYVLGDFFWTGRDRAEKLLRRLHGHKFVLRGNHDKTAHQLRHRFMWFKDVYEGDLGGHRFFMSHYAHRTWPKSHRGAYHVHGHSHGTLDEYPASLDVGIDAHARRLMGYPLGVSPVDLPIPRPKAEFYRPMHLDEVLEDVAKRPFAPVDHHT